MSDAADLHVAVLLRRLRVRPNASSRSQILGQCERAALATALDLKPRLDARLTAIALGPARREDRVLAVALRAGCDHAIRVWDTGLDALDYLGRATVLAAVVRRAGAQLVVCGDRSQDELDGATGPAVAELLGYAHATSVVTVDAGSDALEVRRRNGGSIERLRCRPPCVLCVTRHDGPIDTDETGPARGGAIEECDLDDLSLSPREIRRRTGSSGSVKQMRDGKKNATIVGSAEDLISRLAGDHLLV